MIRFTLFIISLVLILTNSFAQNDNESITIGNKHFIDSKVLNEKREFWVHLPSDYDNSLYNYPVLYVLDGQEHFHQITGLVHHLSRFVQRTPRMIVIGVNSNEINRSRDYTTKKTDMFPNEGGASLFLKFLKEELIPHINSNYRSNNCRLLFGHSMAGILVDYIFTHDNNLFSTYYAADPAIFLDSTISKDFKEMLASKDTIKGSYFLAVSGDVMATTITPNFELYNFIKLNYPDKLNWNFEFYPNDDHSSMTLRSLYDGLEKAFKGYKIPTDYLFTYDMGKIRAHIASIEKKHNLHVAYPEQVINEYAMHFWANRQYENAIELLEINIGNYKTPYETYYFLGEVYSLYGDKKKALLNYEKSLGFKEIWDVKEKIKNLKER